MKNKNTVLASIIFLVVGFFIGSLINFSAESTDNHEGHMMQGHSDTHHGPMEVTENIPSVKLVVHEDPMSGWNLEIITTNFAFAPEGASKDHVPGKGHAHLYLNGHKMTRLYSNWFHVPELDPGEHTLMVTLNSNNHRDYTVNGKNIMAMAKVTSVAR